MGQAAPPRSCCPEGATAYTGTGAGHISVVALVSPRDRPLWGSGTLHCTGSLHTGWGPAPPTHLQPVGPPTYLPHWGPTLYPAGWEDQSLSQGIAPRGGAGRRGGAGERGWPQLSPALLTKSCYCGPCPKVQCLDPPCPGGHLGPGVSGCLPAAPARVGASASGSNEAK